MTSDDWKEIEAAFEHAIALHGMQRDEFVAAFAKEQPNLVRQLRKLLTADDTGDAELKAPIQASLASFSQASTDPWIGRQLGPWLITERLAGGGMGAVFLARRSDDEYSQVVAIKVMAAQLLATDAIDRFKAERQILANLNHPWIASLIDGGSTEDGLPFLVMEYIDGLPVDLYCNRQKLGIEARLDLFRKICSAVDFAHRNLVVHRDLKPSNILVGNHGNPKLLDFGIAKLLQTGSYQQAMTQQGVRVLTPEFASPEQVRGEPISVAADVYSLGVLLYRLITGLSPYGPEVKSSRDYERAIIEDEPQRPSTAVTSPDTAPEVTADRATSPRTLRKQLEGDLDNIVLKALQKEPERRYPTASALSADIRHYLCHEPVAARGDDWAYRARKFAVRNRQGLAVTAMIAILLSSLLTWHVMRLSSERDLTALEAAKAERVANFLLSLFETADPDHARGETITARALLDQGAHRVDTELAGQPALRAAMQDVMGGAYRGLGLYPESQALLEKALATRRELYGELNPDVLQTSSRMAGLAHDRGDYEVSERAFRDALDVSRKLYGSSNPTTASLLAGLAKTEFERGRYDDAGRQYKAAVDMFASAAPNGSEARANALIGYGWLQINTGDFEDAEATLQQSILMLHATVGDTHPDVPAAMNHLTYLYMDTGRWADAEATMREALARSIAIYGDEHPAVNADRETMATIIDRRGANREAEGLYRKALQADLRLLGEQHPYVATDKNNLAGNLRRQGKFEEAEQLYRESLALNRRIHGDHHPESATSQANLALLLTQLGRFDEARPYFENAYEIRKTVLGDEHPATLSSQHIYANFLQTIEQYDAAKPWYVDTLEKRRRILGDKHPGVSTVLAGYATLLRETGQLEEAQATVAEALKISASSLGAEHPTTANAVFILGTIEEASGNANKAIELYRDALAQIEQAPDPDELRRAAVLTALGSLLTDTGEADQALPLIEEGLAVRERLLPAGHWEIGVSRSVLGYCERVLGTDGAQEKLRLAHELLRKVRGTDSRVTQKAVRRLEPFSPRTSSQP
ncbi:MAG TPA: tetratricopeptide repeat protein [Woeseiaceae bacterium]|nr:tetratricopeptide repeat protein [Woeseiaceae bacterium]